MNTNLVAERQHLAKLWRRMVVERVDDYPGMKLLDVVKSLGAQVEDLVAVFVLFLQETLDIV